VVAVKVNAEFFAAALSKRAIMEAWEGGKGGDCPTLAALRQGKGGDCPTLAAQVSKPSVVETNVSHSAGSNASLAEVGLMAPSHERGFQKSSRALALSACSSRLFISTRRVESGTMALYFWGR